MAGSLSDILISQGAAELNKGVDVAGNLEGGIKAGVQLATAAEQIDSTKMKVAEQKQELLTKQATAMMNRTKAAMFAQSPAAFDSIMKANKNYANSLNIPYNDEALRAAYKDPDLRLAAQKEINTVLQGGVSKNPQAIVDFFGSDSPAIFEHLQNTSYANAQVKNKESFELDKQGRQLGSQERIAQLNRDSLERVNANKIESKGLAQTVGEKARDTKFAKDYSSFFDSGGAAGVEANLDSLDSSLKALETGKTSKVTGLLGETVQNFIDPQSAEVKTNVTQVLIQGLKDTFGGQLSDGERMAMVKSVYVDEADPKSNAKRVRAMAEKIKAGARAKELAGQYFEENGTLKGFKGTQSFDIGGKTVKINPESGKSSQAPVQNTSSIDIEAKLKTLPPGADINAARAALIKASQRTAGQ